MNADLVNDDVNAQSGRRNLQVSRQAWLKWLQLKERLHNMRINFGSRFQVSCSTVMEFACDLATHYLDNPGDDSLDLTTWRPETGNAGHENVKSGTPSEPNPRYWTQARYREKKRRERFEQQRERTLKEIEKISEQLKHRSGKSERTRRGEAAKRQVRYGQYAGRPGIKVRPWTSTPKDPEEG